MQMWALLLVAALVVGGTQGSAIPPPEEGTMEYVMANISALWEEVNDLRQEVTTHLHSGHGEHNHDQIQDEVYKLGHEHHVHHLHHPHEGHQVHHDPLLLEHLERIHAHTLNHEQGTEGDHSQDPSAHGGEDHHAEGEEEEGEVEEAGEAEEVEEHEHEHEHEEEQDQEQEEDNLIEEGEEDEEHHHGRYDHHGRDSHHDHHHDSHQHEEGNEHLQYHHEEDAHDHHGLHHLHEHPHYDEHGQEMGHDREYYHSHHGDHHGHGNGKETKPAPRKVGYHGHGQQGVLRPQVGTALIPGRQPPPGYASVFSWTHASCDLQPNVDDPTSNVNGTVIISQKKNHQSPVFFDISIYGIDVQGTGLVHGFHIHENPIQDGSCASAGGHFSPDGTIRHVGDLGKIEVDEEGQLEGFIVSDDVVAFVGPNAIIAKSIVIHAGVNDLGTGGDEASQTTGNAGGLLACCTIHIQKEPHFRFKG